ncbi:MAG TPA: bifunctional lysylphosphatidylglycerol flippase/synthetase MprF [Ottowia sp.]|uniref:bifunctional lysylphosphatidylglycerol flippase/synthetase MprF n=1 Tax=Ottowia sp. TaxID=1898956 RepID=UPI002C9D0B57|nr:bifunctional lysylphosphatidylglycerol flippase/synthetase MprF [Ottowia sp.]HMN19994.1 bifunctional lysylphosphatidylglycerol flippase/synthetase MprF [Ottowia sp.]
MTPDTASPDHADPPAAASDTHAWQRRIARLLEPRLLGPLVGALATLLALFAIHVLGAQVHLREIRAELLALPGAAIAQALLLTAASFGALALYDVLAARRVAPGRVPARLAALAGFVGYGFSNAIGFHVFVGGPIRYRIYQAVGLDAADVARIVSLSALTFGGGLLTLLGSALLLNPAGVPVLQWLGSQAARGLGAVLLLVVAGSVAALARGAARLRLFGWTLPLPGAASAVLQIGIGALDIGAAAGALYVLLPADVVPGYAAFLPVFLAAVVASVVSHAPGGLGVLEATVLLGLGAGPRPDVLAALLAFRAIYYLLPLLLAAAGLLGFEAVHARTRLQSASARAAALGRVVMPPLAAALVLLGGLVLLFSSATPTLAGRAQQLRDWLPLPFVEASHLLASLTGLALVVLAHGLWRRMALARSAAAALMLAGALFSLTRGLDWADALLLALFAAFLHVGRAAFYRRGDWRAFRPTPTWIALIAIVLGGAVVVGLFAYRNVPYRDDLWWQFAWQGDAPRFLRAMLLLAVAAAALALDALLNRPPQPRPSVQPIPAAVRAILARARDTEANVALLGDKTFLVADDAQAFIMYAMQGRCWITMGDPVGEEAAARSLIWRFAEQADRAGARAVFYAVQPAWLPTYLDLGLAVLKIGEVARVDLATFTLEGKARQALRYAHARAARDGLEFAVVPRLEVPALLDELRAVSDAWLGGKVVREKGFSLGRFDPAYLGEFDCAVMRRGKAIVAFANLWRSGGREELSIDLMRYRPGISGVLMDALFAHLLLYGKAEGYAWFNLGAAPLAGLADHPLASSWNRIGTFIYRRGDEFYNFEGLRAFKQKFDPVWTPQYLACRGGLVLPHILFDVTSLIAGGPLAALRK